MSISSGFISFSQVTKTEDPRLHSKAQANVFLSPILSLFLRSEVNDSLVSSLAAALVVASKKINKKDSVTRLKGFSELRESLMSLQQVDIPCCIEAVNAFIPHLAYLFPRLALDNEYKTRVQLIILMRQLITIQVSAFTVPYMQHFIGFWWMLCCDPVDEVSREAVAAFEQTFPRPKKRLQVIFFLIPQIMAHLRTNLSHQVETLSDMSTCSREEAEERYERVQLSCVNALIKILKTLSVDQVTKLLHEGVPIEMNQVIESISLRDCLSDRLWKKLSKVHHNSLTFEAILNCLITVISICGVPYFHLLQVSKSEKGPNSFDKLLSLLASLFKNCNMNDISLTAVSYLVRIFLSLQTITKSDSSLNNAMSTHLSQPIVLQFVSRGLQSLRVKSVIMELLPSIIACCCPFDPIRDCAIIDMLRPLVLSMNSNSLATVDSTSLNIKEMRILMEATTQVMVLLESFVILLLKDQDQNLSASDDVICTELISLVIGCLVAALRFVSLSSTQQEAFVRSLSAVLGQLHRATLKRIRLSETQWNLLWDSLARETLKLMKDDVFTLYAIEKLWKDVLMPTLKAIGDGDNTPIGALKMSHDLALLIVDSLTSPNHETCSAKLMLSLIEMSKHQDKVVNYFIDVLDTLVVLFERARQSPPWLDELLCVLSHLSHHMNEMIYEKLLSIVVDKLREDSSDRLLYFMWLVRDDTGSSRLIPYIGDTLANVSSELNQYIIDILGSPNVTNGTLLEVNSFIATLAFFDFKVFGTSLASYFLSKWRSESSRNKKISFACLCVTSLVKEFTVSLMKLPLDDSFFPLIRYLFFLRLEVDANIRRDEGGVKTWKDVVSQLFPLLSLSDASHLCRDIIRDLSLDKTDFGVKKWTCHTLDLVQDFSFLNVVQVASWLRLDDKFLWKKLIEESVADKSSAKFLLEVSCCLAETWDASHGAWVDLLEDCQIGFSNADSIAMLMLGSCELYNNQMPNCQYLKLLLLNCLRDRKVELVSWLLANLSKEIECGQQIFVDVTHMLLLSMCCLHLPKTSSRSIISTPETYQVTPGQNVFYLKASSDEIFVAVPAVVASVHLVDGKLPFFSLNVGDIEVQTEVHRILLSFESPIASETINPPDCVIALLWKHIRELSFALGDCLVSNMRRRAEELKIVLSVVSGRDYSEDANASRIALISALRRWINRSNEASCVEEGSLVLLETLRLFVAMLQLQWENWTWLPSTLQSLLTLLAQVHSIEASKLSVSMFIAIFQKFQWNAMRSIASSKLEVLLQAKESDDLEKILEMSKLLWLNSNSQEMMSWEAHAITLTIETLLHSNDEHLLQLICDVLDAAFASKTLEQCYDLSIASNISFSVLLSHLINLTKQSKMSTLTCRKSLAMFKLLWALCSCSSGKLESMESNDEEDEDTQAQHCLLQAVPPSLFDELKSNKDNELCALMLWTLVLQSIDTFCRSSSKIQGMKQVRAMCGAALRAFPETQVLVRLALDLVHVDLKTSGNSSPSKDKKLSHGFGHLLKYLRLDDESSSHKVFQILLRHTATFVTFNAIMTLPALMRHIWLEVLDKREKDRLCSFITSFVRIPLMNREMKIINTFALEKKESEMQIRGFITSATAEVIASVIHEEIRIEMKIILPSDYPLHQPEVECLTKGNVSDKLWRRWQLQIIRLLTSQDGSLLEACRMWEQSLEHEFKGLEPCPICYSVLHPKTTALPKLECPTCHNKFHSLCLGTWFRSSGKNKCVICQQPFYA